MERMKAIIQLFLWNLYDRTRLNNGAIGTDENDII